MQIKALKINELSDFIKSDLFSQSDVIPITSIRALSHSNNPRAHSDDISLIIAISDSNKIIGYIGILPDSLQNGERAGWLSCWWVDDIEGKKIGMHLFLMAIKSWDHKFIITDFTPQTKEIIKKTKFFTFTPTSFGIRGFIRFNSFKILPKKKDTFRYFKPFLYFGDFILNVFNDFRLSLIKSRYKSPGIRSEIIDEFTNADQEFISKHNTKEYIQRGVEELNWIIKFPWVYSKDKVDKSLLSESQKYYFSAISKKFNYHIFRLLKDDKIIGLIFLRQRDNDYTIPYFYFEEEYLKDISNFILSHLIKNKANSFTVSHPVLAAYLSQTRSPFFYTRKIDQDFAVTNEISGILDSNKFLQDGDGDYVFT